MFYIYVWKILFQEYKAEYAIGAPTLELLLKSYNQKYGTNNYQVRASSNIGYDVSQDGGSTWTTEGVRFPIGVDDMYKKPDQYWLASPSGTSTGTDRVMYAGYQVHFGWIGNREMGLRPMVCLNSNVQLEKKSDGTYAIK